MTPQVRFFKGTKAQYLALSTPRNQDALYFCLDTQELYLGDLLLSDGIRVIPTHADLPELSSAADGILYYVHDTRNGYMVSPDRTEWLQTIYAPAEDVSAIPESEIYNTVTTVGAVRDIEKKIYERIDEATLGTIPSMYVARKYDISDTPIGTLVDYRDHEIRVMCPANAEFKKQNVGATGNSNMYYMTFKAYAPDGAVSFKEGDRGVVNDQMFTFNGPSSGIDKLGRKYSVCWLALAMYDAKTDSWTYYGERSSTSRYIGWDYIVEWYDTNGVIIASDCVRINLSNESCHFSTEPYYVGQLRNEVEGSTFVGTELPDVGQANKIYVDKEKRTISVWDDETDQYVAIAGYTNEVTDEDIMNLFN